MTQQEQDILDGAEPLGGGLFISDDCGDFMLYFDEGSGVENPLWLTPENVQKLIQYFEVNLP